MSTETLPECCIVRYMEPNEREDLARIKELAVERAEYMATLERVTADLRAYIVEGIRAGWLSELRASKETGLGRTTIRTWLGKT